MTSKDRNTRIAELLAEAKLFFEQNSTWMPVPEDAADGPLAATGTILVAGRVNAGKSSLINALCGRAEGQPGAAPVGPVPDVTRDMSGYAYRDGWSLVDSPGLLSADGLSVALSPDAVARATVLLLVLSPVAIEKGELEFARIVRERGKPLLLVVNKYETLPPEELCVKLDNLHTTLATVLGSDRPQIIPVSAKLHSDALSGHGSPEAARDLDDSRIGVLHAALEAFVRGHGERAEAMRPLDVLALRLQRAADGFLAAEARIRKQRVEAVGQTEPRLGSALDRVKDEADLLLDSFKSRTDALIDRACTEAKSRADFAQKSVEFEKSCLQELDGQYEQTCGRILSGLKRFVEREQLEVPPLRVLPALDPGEAAGVPPPAADGSFLAAKGFAEALMGEVKKLAADQIEKKQKELAELEQQLAKKWIRKGPLREAIKKIEQTLENWRMARGGIEAVGAAAGAFAGLVEKEREDQERVEMDKLLRARLLAVVDRERQRAKGRLADWQHEVQRELVEALRRARDAAVALLDVVTAASSKVEELRARTEALRRDGASAGPPASGPR